MRLTFARSIALCFGLGAFVLDGFAQTNPPPPQSISPRSAVLKEARWGVMTHYLHDWITRGSGGQMTVESWNALVDGFDVEAFAEQLKSTGAGYHLMTIGQNSGYYCAPNATYDRFVGHEPSRCSRRDLIADLYEALNKRGIKLMVYLPSGAPAGDRVARAALQWENGPYRNLEFQRKWEQVIREWSLRWGTKVVGWWFDGCYWPNAMYRSPDAPNFASFAAAARAGNPNSALAFCPGVVNRTISVTPEEDYIGGEIPDWSRLSIARVTGGNVDGAQLHILSYLGQRWGMGEPRFQTEQVTKWSTDVLQAHGVVTWDVPVQRNGTIAQPFVDQLSAIGKAVAAAKPPEPNPTKS